MLTPHAGLRPRTEAEVARACDDLARTLGLEVERYEQRRASRITEGLPDRRYHNGPGGFRVWVELKSPTGKLSLAQHTWLIAEQAAGGFALAIDDPQQLAFVWHRARELYGRAAALEYCVQTTALIAKRGYRREPERTHGRRRG